MEAREAAAEQRERAERAQDFQEASYRAAFQAAVEAGQDVNPRRLRGEQLGHTHAEAVAEFSARMDLEDAQRVARRQAPIRKLLAELGEQDYADTAAETFLAERAEREEQREKRDEDLLRRGRRIQRNRDIKAARKLAAIDRDMAAMGYR